MSNFDNQDKKLCLAEIIRETPPIERQLINTICKIQERNGYIAEDDLQVLADESGQPESALHGLVSFFDHFRTRPLGRNHVSVCYGTACYARGANLVYERLAAELELDDGGNSPDGFITLDKVQCVGACSLAPLIINNGNLEGRIKPHQMPAKLEELRNRDAE